jgi:Tfp pilus assembly major pilin PilA
MFGFSLAKLLVLAAIVAAVWFGFKYYTRIEAKRAADRLKAERAGGRRTAKRESVEDAETQAETMVQCPVCNVYQPAGDTAACERADCPY